MGYGLGVCGARSTAYDNRGFRAVFEFANLRSRATLSLVQVADPSSPGATCWDGSRGDSKALKDICVRRDYSKQQNKRRSSKGKAKEASAGVPGQLSDLVMVGTLLGGIAVAVGYFSTRLQRFFPSSKPRARFARKNG